MKFEWKCPECGAAPNKHGEGGAEKCEYDRNGWCCGFLCECDDDGSKDHGCLLTKPCPSANCYHCGWGGTFPQMPKRLATWEKKALAAGWSPPPARARELKAGR